MPTVRLSVNVDPNEPKTYCKVPVTSAIFFIQAFICLLFVAIAIGKKEPLFLIFSAAQAIVTVVFLLNLYYVIVVYSVLQCAGLIWTVAGFAFFIFKAVNEKEKFDGNGFLWILWLTTLANIYYTNLIFQHLKYQQQLRVKTPLPTSASAPDQENSNQNLVDNMGAVEKQFFPLPSLQKSQNNNF